MATPLLGAALIVKDERDALPDCLGSLADLGPLLSEICVYDTGSTDGTQELAVAAGAEVVQGYWDGDFARARNAAIGHTRARWVLIVDADERISVDRHAFKRALAEALRGPAPADALAVRVANVNPDGSLGYGWDSARLLRRGRARYDGRLHEQVVASRSGTLRLATIPEPVLSLRHLGYSDPEVVHRKLERNTELALAAFDVGLDAPLAQTVQARVDLGRVLLAAGSRSEAIEVLRPLATFRGETLYHDWGLETLAEALLDDERLDEARDVVGAMRRDGVDATRWAWLAGVLDFRAGNHAAAHAALRRIEDLDATFDAEGKRVKVLDARLQAALHVGDRHDARVACARLMVEAGRIAGYGEILMELWGGRSVEELGATLRKFDRGHCAAVAAEVRRVGTESARRVAELLSRPA